MGSILLPRRLYDDVQGLAPESKPSTQASLITFGTITQTTIDLGWTRGDGVGCVVVVRLGTSTPYTPSDNTIISANAQYGLGSNINGGGYVCYIGTGNGTQVTGLAMYTRYTVKVIEYNGNIPDYSAVFKATGFVAGKNPRTFRTQS